MARSKAKGSMEVQSVVLMKNRFRTLASAREWVRSHGFLVSKLDEKQDSWRFRQEPPEAFQAKTFRTKRIDEGILLVVAKRNPALRIPASTRGSGSIYHLGRWWNGNRWVK